MVMNPVDALSAYKKSSGLFDNASGPAQASGTGSGEFGNMVKDFLGDAVTSLHDSETKTASATASGKTDLATVVTAMDNAELVLTEITTIRDKVIAAYQTITSSAI